MLQPRRCNRLKHNIHPAVAGWKVRECKPLTDLINVIVLIEHLAKIVLKAWLQRAAGSQFGISEQAFRELFCRAMRQRNSVPLLQSQLYRRQGWKRKVNLRTRLLGRSLLELEQDAFVARKNR